MPDQNPSEPAWVEVGNRLIRFAFTAFMVILVVFFVGAILAEVLYEIGVGSG